MIRYVQDSDDATRRPIFGPMDSGRLITLEDYERAEYENGYVYEIIDGVLIESPNPVPTHDFWVMTILDCLMSYVNEYPKIANWVSPASEVDVGGRPGTTRPQPDVAVYRDFPNPVGLRWNDVCPIVVAKVISGRRDYKDTVRNRHLYWMAGGIVEYWIVDPREKPLEPVMTCLYRKPGTTEWEEMVVPFGKSYKCRALPKLSINLKRLAAKQNGAN